MGGDKSKICANCDGVMKGCSCQWTGSSDGKIVHKSCKEVYEKKIKKEGVKMKCAHCDTTLEVGLVGESYFRALDGRNVHLRCQRHYELELTKKNKENHASI